MARPIYLAISADPEITDQHKIDAGVHVKSEAAPVGVPSQKPGIAVLSVSGRSVRTRIFDSTAGRRARPYGCSGAYVWSFAGENAPQNLGDWSFWGTTTRPTFDIEFPSSVAPGTKVWLCAAWINSKGQVGPVCDPKSTYMQFGPMTFAQGRGLKAAA